jgi:hypothetical protein
MTPGPFIARLGANWMNADLKAAISGFDGEVNVPTPAAHEKAAAAMKKKTQKLPVFTPAQNAKAKEIVDKVFKDSPIKELVSSVLVGPAPTGRLPQVGKTGYMVGLLIEGTHTKKFIVESAVAKFGGELLGTSRTLSSLPSIMKKAGKTAKWVA